MFILNKLVISEIALGLVEFYNSAWIRIASMATSDKFNESLPNFVQSEGKLVKIH